MCVCVCVCVFVCVASHKMFCLVGRGCNYQMVTASLSADGQDPVKEYQGYDTKTCQGEAQVPGL